MPDPVQASLVHDAKAQPLSSVVRSAVLRARRLMFSAEGTELLLLIAPDRQSERVWMLGQVIDEGVPLEGAAVSVRSSTGSVGRVTDGESELRTDCEGEFRMAELPKGSYGFAIETASRIFTIAPFDID
jgi:hypothetical protein